MTPIPLIQQTYSRHCKANALADTIDLLELTAAELCISVEAVELALEQQEAQAA